MTSKRILENSDGLPAYTRALKLCRPVGKYGLCIEIHALHVASHKGHQTLLDSDFLVTCGHELPVSVNRSPINHEDRMGVIVENMACLAQKDGRHIAVIC